MNITEQLWGNVMPHLREVPNVKENHLLIDNIIAELQLITYKNHYLQKNGVVTLLTMLKDGNLDKIPTDVLRNGLGNVTHYIYLLIEFENDSSMISKASDNFIDTYYNALVKINYFLDLKDED